MHAADVVERPIDLSQSAASTKSALHISPTCYLPSYNGGADTHGISAGKSVPIGTLSGTDVGREASCAESISYPKTKKQKAVDSKTSPALVPTSTDSLLPSTAGKVVSEYEVLTFGEIQERLITKVVESGTLLSDERQHIVDGNITTGVSGGALSPRRLAHLKTSTLQNGTCVATAPTLSPQRGLFPKAGGLPTTSAFPFLRKQQLPVSSAQRMW